VEALVKFPNPKIAETTIREMQEKCLIMGDKYMSLLPVLILFAFENCSHYFNHSVMDCTSQWQ
jgi:hypothetical protein